MRDGLISLLTHLITPHLSPSLPSFYPATPSSLHSSPASKQGKWGTDAARHMVLVEGGRLLLYRSAVSAGPADVFHVGGRNGSGAEGEAEDAGAGGGEGVGVRLRGREAARDEWWRRVVREREGVLRRAEDWAKEDAERREREGREEEQRRRREEEDRDGDGDAGQRRSGGPSTASGPSTPHSAIGGLGPEPTPRPSGGRCRCPPPSSSTRRRRCWPPRPSKGSARRYQSRRATHRRRCRTPHSHRRRARPAPTRPPTLGELSTACTHN